MTLRERISAFAGKFRRANQTTNISGNHNNVEQYVYIFQGNNNTINPGWLARSSPSSALNQLQSPEEASEEADQSEIKRIKEYRAIADSGDVDIALTLLTQLETDPHFSSGAAAFRLHFNIGIISQNIAEYDSASKALRKAHGFLPGDCRAQAGLALAELNQGNVEQALDRALKLLPKHGSHQTLAAIVCLTAAGRLKRELNIDDFPLARPLPPDVEAARLDYLRIVQPDSYLDSINDAVHVYPTNDTIQSMWAMSVLENTKQNQAFLLGARVHDEFEKNAEKAALILKSDLEKQLTHHRQNKSLLSTLANNAAVALRLVGRVAEAEKLLDRAFDLCPDLREQLAEVRGMLFLEESKYEDALQLIGALKATPRLQIMAAEIEALIDKPEDAIARLNDVLSTAIPDELRMLGLMVKARVSISANNKDSADEAFEELDASCPSDPELILLRSAYYRAFKIPETATDPDSVDDGSTSDDTERKLMDSLPEIDQADFLTVFQTANELLARNHYRLSANLLRKRVSLTRESPALQVLCDSCVRGGLATLAKEIRDDLGPHVKNSAFGWKFIANASYLTGEISKAVPPTRRLFEGNPKSLNSLAWYVQSLLRVNNQERIRRLVSSLNDSEMTGNIDEKREYVQLLMFCGEVDRARKFAYRLFCDHRNDHRTWMALSASVLALETEPSADNSLSVDTVKEDTAVEILRSGEDRQIFIIETNAELAPLRDENISLDHPIAQAVLGRRSGDVFLWPLGKSEEHAKILDVKHKILEAFHRILKRFEERFPGVSGFTSVAINPDIEQGLDEMKALLQERADYARQKATEYRDGTYPLPILAFHLGIDPIGAFFSLKGDCGVAVKVSSCEQGDQDKARQALGEARHGGIVIDATACYLILRLGIAQDIEREFGRIGVTQRTVDIFTGRLREAERTRFSKLSDGRLVASSISIRDGKLTLSESTKDQVDSNITMLKEDLRWLMQDCDLIPTIAKSDPDDAVIRFRNQEGGGFLDDIFAASGAERVLLSEDFYLRQWGEDLFGIKSSWIQAMLFHLEEKRWINSDTVIKSTVQLLAVGEEILSLNVEMLVRAAQMRATGALTSNEFEMFCGLVGSVGADMQSHISIAATAVAKIWNDEQTRNIKESITGVILRKLVRNQREFRQVLQAFKYTTGNRYVGIYVDGWAKGHFLT